MIWDSLRAWLLDEGFGNLNDPQCIMVNRNEIEDFADWAKDHDSTFRIVNYTSAPWDNTQTLGPVASQRWASLNYAYYLIYLPDHTQFVYARMAWSR